MMPPSLRQKHVRLLEVVQSMSEENAALHGRITELENNRGNRIDDEERKRIEARFEATIDDLTLSLKAQRGDVERLEAELAGTRNLKGTWEAKAGELATEVEALRAQLELAAEGEDSRLSALAAEAKAQGEAAAAAQAAQALAEGRLAELVRELERLRNTCTDNGAAAAAAHAAAEEWAKSRARLEADLEQEKGAARSLKEELEAMAAALASETQRSGFLDRSLGAAREEGERTSAENARLKEELEDMKEQLRQKGGPASHFAAFVEIKKQNEALVQQLNEYRQRRERGGDGGGGGGEEGGHVAVLAHVPGKVQGRRRGPLNAPVLPPPGVRAQRVRGAGNREGHGRGGGDQGTLVGQCCPRQPSNPRTLPSSNHSPASGTRQKWGPRRPQRPCPTTRYPQCSTTRPSTPSSPPQTPSPT